MSEHLPASPPLQDRNGHAFSVRPFDPRDRQSLEIFYLDFEPKRIAQGLPPEDIQSTRRWLSRILANGRHMLLEIDGRILGHMMLMPVADRPSAYELANFVHQTVRGRGIGTALNQLGIRIAQDDGKACVWLSVEPSNTAAIRSYEKAGFRRIPGSLWAPEIEMEAALEVAAPVHV